MNQSPDFNAVGSQKAFRPICYALVFLMMTCFAMTTGVLIRNLIPGWSSDIIAGITLFIVIDRLYTYKRMRSLIPFSREWAITLGAQWMVILVFIKTLLSFANGFDTLIRDISLFNRGYLGDLFNLEFIATLLLAFLVWHISGQFLELLDEIGLDQTSALTEGSTPVRTDILPAHQRLVNLTLQVGIGLVILTALTRVNLNTRYNNEAFFPDVNNLSGGEAGALFYFIFGFALLCLSRLISLQTRWNQQHIPVASGNMVKQWGTYSFFFLLILMVVVGFLSSGENVGLLSLLGILLDFLIRIFFFIGQLIFLLLSLIASIPFLLLGRNVPVQNEILPIPTPTPPPPDPSEESALPISNPTLALIRSILLWGSLLVIIGFSVARFVKLHGGLQPALRKIPIANWLFFLWQWLSKNADKTRKTLSRAISDAWQSIVSRPDGKRIFPRPAWISLRSLDPRRQIYFFYLAMIRRGSDQGMTRKPSQTPSEYADTLEKALPSLNEDVHLITESFIEARYSPHTIDSQKANLVKVAWERVRRALQIRKNPKNAQRGGK
jgi:hypothetical protein